MRVVLFVLLVGVLGVGPMAVAAQEPTRLTLNLANVPPAYQGKWCYLWALYGNEQRPADSVRLVGNQADFLGNYPAGLYKVGLFPQLAQTLALGQDRTVTGIGTVEATSGKLEARLASTDQQAYDQFLAWKTAYERAYLELQQASRSVAQNPVALQRLYASSDSLALLFNHRMDTLRLRYPNTYAGQYMGPLSQTVLTPTSIRDAAQARAWRRQHFWDGTPWADAAILRNDFLYLKVFQYVQEVPAQTTEEFRRAVDTLMKLGSAQQQVFDFLGNYLAELFGLRGPDELVEYLRTVYAPRMQNILPKTQRTFTRAERLRPGQPALEVVAPDTAAVPQRLSQNLARTATLLYIYSTSCHHCQEHTPQVVQLLKKYRDAGFGVYAVALDEQDAPWRTFIKSIGTNERGWVNVREACGPQSELMFNYGIRRTPFQVLIAPNGDLLSRPLLPDELAPELKEIFGY